MQFKCYKCDNTADKIIKVNGDRQYACSTYSIHFIEYGNLTPEQDYDRAMGIIK